ISISVTQALESTSQHCQVNEVYNDDGFVTNTITSSPRFQAIAPVSITEGTTIGEKWKHLHGLLTKKIKVNIVTALPICDVILPDSDEKQSHF
ncbi:hypothetical protein BG006_004045, partial [Podila minutissima]